MHETEITFTSHDKVSEIRALVWEPDELAKQKESKKPLAVIQILHGMAEHIERYRDFASYCTEQGFIVCGHDHIGHGKSASSQEELGVIAPDGMTTMIEDVHILRLIIQGRYKALAGETPLSYCLFGHSMGSFVLRNYLAVHAEGLSAAVICGTGHQAAAVSGAGRLVSRFLHAVRGPEHRSTLLHNMSVGAFSKAIEGARTPLDWLSTDESVVAAYSADPYSGFMFSAGGNATLTSLTGAMVKRETVAAVPTDLPLLFIAGKEDPVGEKGEAVKRAVALFEDTGHDRITLILYEGMRHEVLNEVGKEKVYQDVTSWLKEQLQVT